MSTSPAMPVICDFCEQEVHEPPGSLGRGFCILQSGHQVCYECVAKYERDQMKTHGRCILYLAHGDNGDKYEVTNWPGTLTFKVISSKEGKHNLARTRTDVWFNGPDNYVWHGVQYGDYTAVCHCQRTKRKVKGKEN